MPLKWAAHVGAAWSAVGDEGTWVIVNIGTVERLDWWLSVQARESNEIEERGRFGTREEAERHAQSGEDSYIRAEA